MFHVTPEDGLISLNICIQCFYCFILRYSPRSSPNKSEHVSPRVVRIEKNAVFSQFRVTPEDGLIGQIIHNIESF